MRICSLLLALVCLAALSTPVYALNPVYSAPARYKSVNARILALSSSVHTAEAGNQETYIAEIWQGPGSKHRIVKLIDNYPSYGVPIRRTLLRGHKLFGMRVSRFESCDASAVDASVLPPRSIIFTDGLVAQLDANHKHTLLCFRIDHASTRLAKEPEPK